MNKCALDQLIFECWALGIMTIDESIINITFFNRTGAWRTSESI